MELRDQLQATLGAAYTLDRELGGGGMSRVFVATENALGRQIVVKVLPPESSGHVSIERFKREIKLAASLQHPHIVPLLSAGESEGLPFYTMPFVKGESLRERLVKGGGELSVKDAIHVMHDVASALAYAHREGIVHRDIKPENIILSGGVAVVTDFGVSKALNVATDDGSAVHDSLTSLGVALGTPAYMSPEQASADPRIDHRADIYSFGCVAYELLVGASPFAGRPPRQMLSAHVTEAPDPVERRRPSVPPALSALVSKCLEKRAGDRPQSAEELLAALDTIATPRDGMQPTTERRAAASGTRARWVAAGVATTLGVLGLLAWLPRFGDRDSTLKTGQVTPIATSPTLEMNPAISRDGKLVAYVAGSPGSFRIFVRQIGGQRPVLLSGELDGDHGKPAWSPDGSRIAFEANNAIYTVPSLGGTPQPFVESGKEWQRLVLVAARATTSPAWSPDGTRLAFANAGGMWIKPASAEARRVAEGGLFHSMSWSPDGQALLFVEGITPSLGNLSASVVGVMRLDGRRTTISDSTHVNLSPVWMPDGRTMLYVSNRDGALDVYEQRLDRDLRPDGASQRITTGLLVRTISVSADGTRLAYDVVRNRSNLWQIPIPPTGAASFATAKQITTENQRIESFSVSHDGQWLAYDSDRGGNANIYKIRIDDKGVGGEPIQLTKDPGNDFAPSWSPNDRELAFHSSRSGARRVYTIDAEGNNERQVTSEGEDAFAPDWSPDGTRLVFMTSFGGNRGDAVIGRKADGTWSAPRRITAPMVQATWARWSPDGRLIAYPMLRRNAATALAVQSADSGSPRILVDPSPADGTVLWTTWGADPTVLYYSTGSPSGRQAFWSVPVRGGAPRLLFRDDDAHRISRFDFATDGKRLFLNIAADESDVYVVELKR